ncbi:MAG: TorF family putative porin [Sphingomonadaceae bacterium]
MKFRTFLAAAAFIAPLAAMPNVALAQDDAAEADEASGPFEISGEVGVLTDYRFRGLSLSGHNPELTASVTVEHESGLYASAWASNVDLGLGGADNVEVDWTAGFSKDVGNVNIDVGAIYYSYMNHGDFNYVEGFGSIGIKLGAAEVRVGAAYAPKQDNIGGQDNTYVYVSGDLPLGKGPFSLHGTFGYENGAFADHKKDWLIGASVDLGNGATLSADYVDTAHDFTGLGGETAVVSLKWGF